MITPEPVKRWTIRGAVDGPAGLVFEGWLVSAAGHLGVVEEKCGGAHWPLEYFPERHCGGCGAAL